MRKLPLGLLTAVISLLLGCGRVRVHHLGGLAGFELDPESEVKEPVLGRSIDSPPRFEPPLKVAYASLDPARLDAIHEMLESLPQVSETYAIPSLLIVGQPSLEVPSIKKMRLMAARARCDLLIIFDYAHRARSRTNWLAWFNVLLLPFLASPYLDEELDSFLEGHLMEVRTGQVFAQVTVQEHGAKAYSNIYSSWVPDTAEEHWQSLLRRAGEALQRELMAVAASAPTPEARPRSGP